MEVNAVSEVMLSAMSRLRRLIGRGADKVEILDYMACIRLSDDLEGESESEGGSKEGSGKNGTETPTGDQAPKNEPPKPDDTVIDDFDYGKPFESQRHHQTQSSTGFFNFKRSNNRKV